MLELCLFFTLVYFTRDLTNSFVHVFIQRHADYYLESIPRERSEYELLCFCFFGVFGFYQHCQVGNYRKILCSRILLSFFLSPVNFWADLLTMFAVGLSGFFTLAFIMLTSDRSVDGLVCRR